MAISLFKWGNSGSCPDLEPHSAAKLDILRQYVIDYLRILVGGALGKERFKITFVDAFAGGGRYSKGEDGSPFVFLKAVRDAQALINCEQRRYKTLSIDAHYYFVERSKAAFTCLSAQLEASDWRKEIGKSVFLSNADFQHVVEEIISKTKSRHPKGGCRVIFFLDQCGWAKVNAKMIAAIAAQLNHKAEFILNFSCDWLSAYVSGDQKFRKTYDGLGLEDIVSVDELLKLKKQTDCDYRYAVAAKLGPALQTATRSPFFSPFYVEPTTGSNHGYWLVHLAPHLRARNAMMDVYYRNQTHIRAFGNTGLRMLAFRPDVEPTGHLIGFHLDNETLIRARKHLATDLAKDFRSLYPNGTTFRALCQERINDTVANVNLLGDAAVLLAQSGELNIHGPNGGNKRTDAIELDDRISLNPAPFLALPGLLRARNLSS
jgi:three-Cys-motif partner protein